MVESVQASKYLLCRGRKTEREGRGAIVGVSAVGGGGGNYPNKTTEKKLCSFGALFSFRGTVRYITVDHFTEQRDPVSFIAPVTLQFTVCANIFE
jgi:hypothetical protein